MNVCIISWLATLVTRSQTYLFKIFIFAGTSNDVDDDQLKEILSTVYSNIPKDLLHEITEDRNGIKVADDTG